MKVLVLDRDQKALDFVRECIAPKLSSGVEVKFLCVDGILSTENVIREMHPEVLFLGVDHTNGDDGLFIAHRLTKKIEVYLMSDYLTDTQKDLASLSEVPCMNKIPNEIQKIIELDRSL